MLFIEQFKHTLKTRTTAIKGGLAAAAAAAAGRVSSSRSVYPHSTDEVYQHLCEKLRFWEGSCDLIPCSMNREEECGSISVSIVLLSCFPVCISLGICLAVKRIVKQPNDLVPRGKFHMTQTFFFM